MEEFMMKSISIFLILCLLYSWFGCYISKQTITEKSELQNFLHKGDKLYLMNKDSIVYFFNSKTYKIVNDTLWGKGQMVIHWEKQSSEFIEIAVNDILNVNTEQSRIMSEKAESTITIITATVGLIAVIILAVTLSTW